MGFPEQTGLQPGLHYVEWARNDGSGHATNPSENNATMDVRIRALGANYCWTHAPPTKCCHDLAGTHFDCAASDIGKLDGDGGEGG